MKVEKAACGASYKGGKVKAAAGGMMQMVKKTGYSTGGMAEKAYAKKAEATGAKVQKATKDDKPVEAAKGGAMKKKTIKICSGCPSPGKCKAAGKCLAKG
jgi:hypothetical protein